jgi:hypothetical protein
MRLLRTLKRCTIALATIGIVFPPSAVLGAQLPTGQATQTIRVADVALGHGGVLRGQVVNAEGIGQPGMSISVQRQGKEVAQLKTDLDGKFAAAGLQSGTYMIATDGAIGPVRAWAPKTAPPAAADGLLLISAGQTVRGGGNRGLGLLTNPGIWITGALIGTILVIAIDQNSGS